MSFDDMNAKEPTVSEELQRLHKTLDDALGQLGLPPIVEPSLGPADNRTALERGLSAARWQIAAATKKVDLIAETLVSLDRMMGMSAPTPVGGSLARLGR